MVTLTQAQKRREAARPTAGITDAPATSPEGADDSATTASQKANGLALGLTPDVLFIEDVARILRTSRSTVERRRGGGTFPIPELPSIDGRPRWSRQAVERFLASTSEGMRSRRGRPRHRRGVN